MTEFNLAYRGAVAGVQRISSNRYQNQVNASMPAGVSDDVNYSIYSIVNRGGYAYAMMLHLLAIVSIPLVSGIDGTPYIDFVLQHTGKKLSFGDPNEGTEGDVQDTHPAEQPNNPDEK